MSEITITLSKIAGHEPCNAGWDIILSARGYEPCHWSEFPGDDTEFPLANALESNNISDVLWALRCLPEHDSLWRKYAVWCAAQVRHLMTDKCSLEALRVAWLHADGLAMANDLEAASDTAWAAAQAAASAAWAAAWAAAWDAAQAAAWAAWAAAWDAAQAAAWDAAQASASAARDVACGAIWVAQGTKLQEILTAGKWVGPCPVQDLIDGGTT